MVRRITGLQRQVFNTYKRALKMIATKPIEYRPSWYAFISHQFRSPSLGGGLTRKDVGAIEYYLRRIDKMLDSYEGPGTTKSTVSDQIWNDARGRMGWIAKGGKDRPRRDRN